MTERDAAADVMATGGFDGETYDDTRDRTRLARQMAAVRRVMAPGDWWTLGLLAAVVGAPEASVSARIRDLRKPRFGGYTVEKRYRARGVWEYRMVPEEREQAA